MTEDDLPGVPGLPAAVQGGGLPGWREEWLRTEAAVSEGLCPVHGTALTPADSAHAITGHCGPCGAYWFADPGEEAGWSLDEERRQALTAWRRE